MWTARMATHSWLPCLTRRFGSISVGTTEAAIAFCYVKCNLLNKATYWLNWLVIGLSLAKLGKFWGNGTDIFFVLLEYFTSVTIKTSL